MPHFPSRFGPILPNHTPRDSFLVTTMISPCINGKSSGSNTALSSSATTSNVCSTSLVSFGVSAAFAVVVVGSVCYEGCCEFFLK